MKSYKIYTVYHDDSLLRYKADTEPHRIWYDVREDKGLNYMNPVWSEMVCMWYVWKHTEKTDYVGFNHYRRQFDIRRFPKKGECQIYRTMDFGERTLYQQYADSHRHEDMDDMLSLVDKKYGKDNPYSRHIRESHILISNCCYFMRWDEFGKLCNFLFDMIDDYSRLTGCNNYLAKWRLKAERDFGGEETTYQMRIISFLAERLISAWISTHMKTYQQKDVVICHFNTPEVTEACIRSLFKHTPYCDVFIFDNSTKRPFTKKMNRVHVIDNTKHKYIDFERMLARYPNRVDETVNNWASAQHCYTVDYCFDLFPNGFILMDSDILIKQDISFMWNYDVAWTGMPYVKRSEMKTFVERLLPFLCWINVPMCRINGIRYFDGRRMWKLRKEFPWKYYDTGAVLFHDCKSKQLPTKRININDYMIHLCSASFARSEEKRLQWLKDNESLWK